jgi:hypothetical protein
MEVSETLDGCRDWLHFGGVMPRDFGSLARGAISAPGGDIFCQLWPDISATNEPPRIADAWVCQLVDRGEYLPPPLLGYQWH